MKYDAIIVVLSSETGHRAIKICTDAKNIRKLLVEICDKYSSLKKKLFLVSFAGG